MEISRKLFQYRYIKWFNNRRIFLSKLTYSMINHLIKKINSTKTTSAMTHAHNQKQIQSIRPKHDLIYQSKPSLTRWMTPKRTAHHQQSTCTTIIISTTWHGLIRSLTRNSSIHNALWWNRQSCRNAPEVVRFGTGSRTFVVRRWKCNKANQSDVWQS